LLGHDNTRMSIVFKILRCEKSRGKNWTLSRIGVNKATIEEKRKIICNFSQLFHSVWVCLHTHHPLIRTGPAWWVMARSPYVKSVRKAMVGHTPAVMMMMTYTDKRQVI
jgi:hypothetical protein